MKRLFEVKKIDQTFYKENLKDFMPDKIIDVHTHIWLDKFITKKHNDLERTVNWPSLVAKDNPVENLIETYRLLFPGKHVIPLLFSNISSDNDEVDGANEYVIQSATKYGFPSLIFASPRWSSFEFEKRILTGNFLGCKVYLTFAESNIPENEIKIFDFLPHHQLKVLDKHGWIVMLHIPRSLRLKDPVNLNQMIEIEQRYPNIKLIIAHVGRAYCPEDIGNAFEILSETKKMMFDFSANTNSWVFEQLIKSVGPKRILYGSDMPITRMRMCRICENGNYVNIVPAGIYGDLCGDVHMREVYGEEAEQLSFFLYEEIRAFRFASEVTSLTNADIEDIFYNNAANIISKAKFNS